MSRIVWAIVPAGGLGERFGQNAGQDKLMAMLGGVPVLLRTVRQLVSAASIAGVVVAAHTSRVAAYTQLLDDEGFAKEVVVVEGGATRRASVWCGIEALMDGLDELDGIVVHDAARPLIEPALIDRSVEALFASTDEHQVATVVGIPVQDTVKWVDPERLQVRSTLDRTGIWRAQTPQVFLAGALVEAHQGVSQDEPVTDDVQLVEKSRLGTVTMVPGEERNLKITTPADLAMAERWLAEEIAPPSVKGVMKGQGR